MVAERSRPDVIQMSHALQSRALLEGVDLASHFDRFLKDFQDASLSDSRKFSAWEIAVVKLFPNLTEVAQDKLAYHYQAYDVESSAWPLGKLASEALSSGARVARVSSSSALPLRLPSSGQWRPFTTKSEKHASLGELASLSSR